MDGSLLPASATISIPAAVDTFQLSVDLPKGFQAAEGFSQALTVSASGYRDEIDLLTLADPVSAPLPDQDRVVLTISIGFCTMREKDICYIDRSELVIVRTQNTGTRKNTVVRYSPEDPS